MAVMIRRTLSALFLSVFLTALANAQQQPVRVAIVGLEHGHVVGFLHEFPRQHDAQLVGIVDSDHALCARYQREFHLDPSLFYNSIDDLFAHQRPQALLVYTNIAQHRRVIEAAAAHNVDAMVEKPLTLSLADALAIRRVAREHHIQVLVNYETTWYPSNAAIENLLRQGKLGNIRKVIIRDGHQGPKEIGVQPEFLQWLTDPALNGAGALYDFGCYGADLMTWFMHGEAPLSVTAVAHTDKPQIYSRVDDDATIVLQYPHAQAVLLPSWNWTFGVKDTQVYGTKAYVIADNGTHLRERFNEKDSEEPVTATPLAAPDDSSLHYLAAVIRGQLAPKGDLTALDTNIVVMQILDAARTSARTRRTIDLRPIQP